MRHAAVWRAANIYADLISTLPFSAYRDVDGVGIKLPSQPKIITNPAVSVRRIAWRAQAIRSMVLRGNAYGLILTRDQFGYPTTIELQHPDCVAASWNQRDLTRRYLIDGVEVPEEDVWHVSLNETPGTPFGLSMIEYAAKSIYEGVAATHYSNAIFEGGGHPTAIIKSDKELTTQQSSDMKQSFMNARRSGEPMSMGAGSEYIPIQVSPKDMMFLDAMNASLGDVANFAGLPVEMLGGSSGDSLTYATVEGKSADLLRFSIAPVLERFQEALTDALPQPQYVKANSGKLLATLTKDRYETHHIALSDGWRSVNEIRQLEDLPPIPGGDEYKSPQAAPAVPPQVAP